MRKQLLIVTGVVFLAACVLGWVGGVAVAEEAQHQYIGVAKCKMCHKSEAAGQQFVLWEKTAHAKAYETLAGEKAMAIAKEKGIEDPQKADECLSCHVTAHGVKAELLGDKYAVTDGVGCESCHGAGGDYNKKSVMEAITAGTTDAASVGLVIPDEKTCTGCHNEKSPTFKGFEYEKMVAKIAHPIPEERKAQYKEAGGSK